MKYIRGYEPELDLVFQSEISDETISRLPSKSLTNISEAPFDGLPIMPRRRSTWDLDVVNKHLSSLNPEHIPFTGWSWSPEEENA